MVAGAWLCCATQSYSEFQSFMRVINLLYMANTKFNY